MARKKLAIFGSTGSIGKSALNIVRRYPDELELVALFAGSNHKLLAEQVREFSPKFAGLADASLKGDLVKLAGNVKTKFIFTPEEISAFAASPDYEIMLAAIVGFSGLESLLNAVKSGKKIALANKEALVAAGDLVLKTAALSGAQIIPVDSEHSAVFQLLQNRDISELESITITASGGPFLYTEVNDLSSVTAEDALKHPRWKMGPKISLDSATMFNKALELIEAHWLFGLDEQKIEVLVHPQSIVHGMLNFIDGSVFAHLSDTDMQGAIAYALGYPLKRYKAVLKRPDLTSSPLEFLELDLKKFPAVSYARSALKMGGAACAVLNSANEYAGAAFLNNRIGFLDIARISNQALEQFSSLNYSNLDDLTGIDLEVKSFINQCVKSRKR